MNRKTKFTKFFQILLYSLFIFLIGNVAFACSNLDPDQHKCSEDRYIEYPGSEYPGSEYLGSEYLGSEYPYSENPDNVPFTCPTLDPDQYKCSEDLYIEGPDSEYLGSENPYSEYPDNVAFACPALDHDQHECMVCHETVFDDTLKLAVHQCNDRSKHWICYRCYAIKNIPQDCAMCQTPTALLALGTFTKPFCCPHWISSEEYGRKFFSEAQSGNPFNNPDVLKIKCPHCNACALPEPVRVELASARESSAPPSKKPRRIIKFKKYTQAHFMNCPSTVCKNAIRPHTRLCLCLYCGIRHFDPPKLCRRPYRPEEPLQNQPCPICAGTPDYTPHCIVPQTKTAKSSGYWYCPINEVYGSRFRADEI